MAAESSLEKKLCRYAVAMGIWTRKFSSPGNTAVPDRIFMSPHGVALFMEIKAAKKKPTPAQWDEIDIIQGQKGNATWVDTYERGVFFLDMLAANTPARLGLMCREWNNRER